MSSAIVRIPDTQQAKSLTEMLETKLANPTTSPEPAATSRVFTSPKTNRR
jgi:hypothetical protein